MVTRIAKGALDLNLLLPGYEVTLVLKGQGSRLSGIGLGQAHPGRKGGYTDKIQSAFEGCSSWGGDGRRGSAIGIIGEYGVLP